MLALQGCGDGWALLKWAVKGAAVSHRGPSLSLAARVARLGLAAALAIGTGSAAIACDVKGNISRNTGERIYHVPGQRYYDETQINEAAGERWFCSEEEAREAGWRRATR